MLEEVIVDELGLGNCEEEESASTMYIAPPFVAEQSWIETLFTWKVLDEGIDAYTHPPFPFEHVQDWADKPVSVRVEEEEKEEEIERMHPSPDVRVMDERVSEESVRVDGYVVYVINGAFVSVIDVIVDDEHEKVPDPNESKDADVVTPEDAVMSVLDRVSVPLDVMENRGALHVDVSVIESVSVLTLASVFDPLIVSAGFVVEALVTVTVFVDAERVPVDGRYIDPAMHRMV